MGSKIADVGFLTLFSAWLPCLYCKTEAYLIFGVLVSTVIDILSTELHKLKILL